MSDNSRLQLQQMLLNSQPGPSTLNRPILRKDKFDDTEEAWLLGKLLPDLQPRVGSQLPTNGEVLRLFFYLNRM